MDGLLTGSNTISEALLLRNKVINILRKGGFELQKWAASDPILLEDIPNSDNDNNEKNLVLELDNCLIKILGLVWNPERDVLQYKITPYKESTKINKRKILSENVLIYDPLGLIGSIRGPILTQAKLFLRTLFCEKFDWDELPEKIESEWIAYKKNLCSLKKLFIPRSIISDNGITEIQIRGFSDASIMA